ncbi:F-box protein FBW2-like [Macadamia integrifolia]|uniref:F-box protein FBW2-like n=1 Tax=Macadamia integrifolia TaxID=60698 RepID=UPI001C4FBE80|nr:F-box protein FBW2-like [Macadamia integrifolia]
MEGSEIRCWNELFPDVLWLIFSKISFEEKLTVIPRICKSWRKVVLGLYCWQVIDILAWSHYRPKQLAWKGINFEEWIFQLDQMLRMLIIRCSGAPRKLCVSDIPNDAIFSFIANHASSLETLQMPGSKISDSIVEKVAGKMCAITFLDLSYCDNIGALALEAFGSNCRLLSSLKRNMHSPSLSGVCQDDEARAIASTMPELKHLEIADTNITTEGVLDILSGCQKLVFLDVRGCWDVKLDDKVLNEKWSGMKVRRYYYCSFDDIPEGFVI